MMPQPNATLFQIHANITTLKSALREIAPFWRTKDCLLLLGTTITLADWLTVCIDEMNFDEMNCGEMGFDEELAHRIDAIGAIYALQQDYARLNDTTKANLDLQATTPPIQLIDDDTWVALTQTVAKVVTIDAK